jgi:hypothetical protein
LIVKVQSNGHRDVRLFLEAKTGYLVKSELTTLELFVPNSFVSVDRYC